MFAAGFALEACYPPTVIKVLKREGRREREINGFALRKEQEPWGLWGGSQPTR